MKKRVTAFISSYIEEEVKAHHFYFGYLHGNVVINMYIKYQEIKLSKINPELLTEEDFKNFWIQYLHKKEEEELFYNRSFLTAEHIKSVFEEVGQLTKDLIPLNKIRDNDKEIHQQSI